MKPTKKELLKALKLVQDYCESRMDCTIDCRLENICPGADIPCRWNLGKK